ncbi:MAG: LBF_2804 family protein [Fluviicola sp.]
MEEIQNKRNKSIAFRLGNTYLSRKTAGIRNEDRHGYTLNAVQKTQLRNLQVKIYLIAGLIGAGAVLIVIFPFHFTSLLDAQHFDIFGYQFDFELYYTIYAVAMLFPEIWLLNMLNIYAVRRICEIYKYPSVSQNDYEEQVALLTEAGLEMPAKHMKLLEIDPYVGLTKFSYYAWLIGTKLKATLSNVLMKFLVRRLLGRYALRIVTDLIGVPIFAFWNAWSSRQVIKETRMRIVATAATKDFMSEFSPQELEQIKEKLARLFHFVAQQKRQYNFALYSFMKEMMAVFPDLNLKYDQEVKIDELFGSDPAENKLLARLLIFGLLVDGTLSVKERLTIRKIARLPKNPGFRFPWMKWKIF